MLSRIGFDVSYVPGGYKKYRETTLKYLKEEAASFITSRREEDESSEGKLLDALEKRGAQVIDLERFAEHRGSVLGERSREWIRRATESKNVRFEVGAHKMRKFGRRELFTWASRR